MPPGDFRVWQFRTSGDVRSSVAIGGKPDIVGTARFGREGPKADITRRSGRSCLREPATYFIVKVPGGPNVPHDCACSRRARQFVPARASLRAADPARWIGRGWQFGDQRRAVWSCQSQGPLGPQRHRKCLKSAAAPQQHPGTRGLLNTDGTDTGRHAAFLSERVAADHRHDCCRAEKQGTASPARSPAG
jgi:hypothetical protein